MSQHGFPSRRCERSLPNKVLPRIEQGQTAWLFIRARVPFELTPVMVRVGVDPVYFGVVMSIHLGIGLVTPPVGMCLNVANKICGIPITQITRHAMPWIVCNVIVLILVTFIPEVSAWLPSIIG